MFVIGMYGPVVSGAEDGYEAHLVRTLERVQQSNIMAALRDAKGLVTKYSNSRLAQLVYADMLMAMIGNVDAFGGLHSRPPYHGRVNELREEALSRLRHRRGENPAYQGLVPANLLYLGDQRFAAVVDLGASRLYVYENVSGLPHLIRDYYVSMGVNGAGKNEEGDQRTPVGVYRVTSYLAGTELPDRYGPGAFPINYPNPWDRRHRRTGHGIWLHGSPSSTYSRAPRSSDGCVALSNPDFRNLEEYVQPHAGFPVIIAEDVEWVPADELTSRRGEALSLLDRWRRDWESLDTEKYLSHYSKSDFLGFGKDYKAWAKHKRRVNRGKTFVQVRFGVRGLYMYPGEKDVLSVELDQRYLSNNYEGRVHKQQYWRRGESGRWQIIHEGSG